MNLKIVPFVAIPLILIAGHSEQQLIQTLLTQAQLPVLAAPQPSTHQPPASPTTKTQRVYLAGRRVSFVPPAGFTAMTPEEIALKFPQGTNQPQPVYANKRRTVSIAITFSQAQVSPAQLPELKNFLSKFLELAVPDDIEWITQDFTVINKVRWIQLEFISKAIDTNIHNDAYFTSFDGKMLGFNFNSTVEQYDAVKAELRKSRDSIIIR